MWPAWRAPQVKCFGELGIVFRSGWSELSGRVAESEETGRAAGFRFVGVDRKCFVVSPARVRDVISASSDRTPRPQIENIEHEWRMDPDGRMQARGWLPGAIAHTGDVFAFRAGWVKRHAAFVAGHHVALGERTTNLYL